MQTQKIELTKILRAPAARVYKAFVDAANMQRWLCPEPGGCRLAASEPVESGYYMVLMVVGEIAMPHHGVYKRLEPPHRIAFTWNSHFVEDTLVEIDLVETDGVTALTLTHSGFDNADECDKHRGGWTACLANLEIAVAS